jgi:hypothetical protein
MHYHSQKETSACCMYIQSDQYNQHDGQQKVQLLGAQEFPYQVSPFENCNITSI